MRPPRGSDDLITARNPTSGLLAGVGFTVTVATGPEAGHAIHLDASDPRRVLIGKSPVCDLVLSDSMVSRRHAALEFAGLRLNITDLDSTNGTLVNEVSVQAAHLNGGETVRLGSTMLRVEMHADAPKSVPKASAFGRLVGASPRMRSAFALCHALAASDLPLIIEGETGTGKELVAECLHEASSRAAGPFIVFDCAATARGATELALFGQVAPDRQAVRTGVFEAANGGTLLIDDVGALELEVQGALLRAVERGEIKRLGDDRWTRVNVRTIVATSRDLEKLVEGKRFREDLFFRLAVGRIELPPLRKRAGDVALLADHFLRILGAPPSATADFVERFRDYDWPGNVRELSNAVSRFVTLGPLATLVPNRPRWSGAPAPAAEPPPSNAVRSDVITEILAADLPFPQARQRVLDTFERAYVERILTIHNGNVARAAAASGIARRYFQLIRSRQVR
jgi:DNA-binding NtrC family response regulator